MLACIDTIRAVLEAEVLTLLKILDCRLLKKISEEARDKSTRGGVLSRYVGASRIGATKHMSLFQQPA